MLNMFQRYAVKHFKWEYVAVTNTYGNYRTHRALQCGDGVSWMAMDGADGIRLLPKGRTHTNRMWVAVTPLVHTMMLLVPDEKPEESMVNAGQKAAALAKYKMFPSAPPPPPVPLSVQQMRMYLERAQTANAFSSLGAPSDPTLAQNQRSLLGNAHNTPEKSGKLV